MDDFHVLEKLRHVQDGKELRRVDDVFHLLTMITLASDVSDHTKAPAIAIQYALVEKDWELIDELFASGICSVNDVLEAGFEKTMLAWFPDYHKTKYNVPPVEQTWAGLGEWVLKRKKLSLQYHFFTRKALRTMFLPNTKAVAKLKEQWLPCPASFGYWVSLFCQHTYGLEEDALEDWHSVFDDVQVTLPHVESGMNAIMDFVFPDHGKGQEHWLYALRQLLKKMPDEAYNRFPRAWGFVGCWKKEWGVDTLRLLAKQLPIEKEKIKDALLQNTPAVLQLKGGDFPLTIFDTMRELVSYDPHYPPYLRRIEKEVDFEAFLDQFDYIPQYAGSLACIQNALTSHKK